ncbi:hypothetical protein [Kitasatospora sp. NPDC056181]|uniref:hypothetical protein n=1 Tax=Kitasatospora sp. NPDC056181 TaxID=3345737 RepID=UPI0035DE0B9F
MDIIVAGQRVVSAFDFIEAAGFEPAPAFEPNTSEDLAACRDALADFLDDLVAAADADNEVDQLDIAHYRQLLRRMPTPLRGRDIIRRSKARKAVAA